MLSDWRWLLDKEELKTRRVMLISGNRSRFKTFSVRVKGKVSAFDGRFSGYSTGYRSLRNGD